MRRGRQGRLPWRPSSAGNWSSPMELVLAIAATAVAFVALCIFLMTCSAEKVARDSSKQPPLRQGDWVS